MASARLTSYPPHADPEFLLPQCTYFLIDICVIFQCCIGFYTPSVQLHMVHFNSNIIINKKNNNNNNNIHTECDH